MIAQRTVDSPRSGNPLGLHDPAQRRRLALVLTRILLLVWAAFWSWFNLVSAFGEESGGLQHTAMFLIIVALVVLAWLQPKVGGVVLLATAVFSAFFFHHPAARLLLSLPAFLLAVAVLWTARWSVRSV